MTGKSIFIVSPQNWKSRPVSKHHYAEALAKSNTVYFLNPPNCKRLESKIISDNPHSNLYILSVILPIPYYFKFKLEGVYRFFWTKAIKRILKDIGSIDYLWNFDNGTFFKEIRFFKDSLKIFHPVDDFNVDSSFKYSMYDIGFSLSSEILKKIPLKNKYFINHGLQAKFTFNRSKKDYPTTPKHVVYMGNLSIPFLDTSSIRKIINNHQELNFSFIGDYNQNSNFIQYLKKCINVKLLGLKKGQELFDLLLNADILLICYKKMPGYFADNTHKLLEYLSTGNVVVSSRLSVYDKSNLFLMSLNDDNSDFVGVFEDSIKNFAIYNSQSSRDKRIQFAIDNTYDKQIEKIDSLLSS